MSEKPIGLSDIISMEEIERSIISAIENEYLDEVAAAGVG